MNFTYTGAGQLAGRVTSDGVHQTFQRDLDSRLTSTQDAMGTTSTTYDAAGRLALMVHSDGSRVRYVNDLAGQLTELGVTPPGGQPEIDEQRTVYAYDLVGNLITIQDALGGQIHLEYDAVHRPVRRVFPNGIETLWQYDLRDRILLVEHRRTDDSVHSCQERDIGSRGRPDKIESRITMMIPGLSPVSGCSWSQELLPRGCPICISPKWRTIRLFLPLSTFSIRKLFPCSVKLVGLNGQKLPPLLEYIRLPWSGTCPTRRGICARH